MICHSSQNSDLCQLFPLPKNLICVLITRFSKGTTVNKAHPEKRHPTRVSFSF